MDKESSSLNKSARNFFTAPRRAKRSGVSLQELLIVIGVIAVLGAIAVPVVLGLLPAASTEVAASNLRLLNRAVLAYNQTNKELNNMPQEGDTDEIAVFTALKHRDTINPIPGSPFLKEGVVLVISHNDEDYRASWNGRMFQMLTPGMAGVGLDLLRVAGGEEP